VGEVHQVSGEAHATSTVSGSATLIYLEESLLRLAERLIDEDQPSSAIVIAHVACEAAVTRCLARLLAARGVEDLSESVMRAMNGHSLVSTGNKALYRALTGDDSITKVPFWKAYHESAEWRNQIVHNGKVYGRPDAVKCIDAARGFVAHVHEQVGVSTGA
jgi:hypothetical protein